MSFFGSDLTTLTSEYTWDPRTGLQVIKRWQGTPTAITTQANAALLLGLRFEVQELGRGGYQELRVFYGATETSDPDVPLADIWSLNANEVEKSLWTLDPFLSTFASLSAQDIADLRRDVEALIAGDDSPITGAPVTVTNIVDALPTADQKAMIQVLIKALSKGVEVKPISAPVIRRTLIVPFNTNLRPSMTGVDKIISKTNLAAGGDPGGTPPSSILFILRDGWYRKRHAEVEQTSATTWPIVQEWWWFGTEYDTYTWETYP